MIGVHHPDGLILIVDKRYRDRDTETWLNETGITVIRPAYRTEPQRPGRGLLKAVRQSIESVGQHPNRHRFRTTRVSAAMSPSRRRRSFRTTMIQASR